MLRRLFLILAAFSFVVAPTAASADPSKDHAEARSFVSSLHQELQSAIKASKDPKSDPKLMAIFDRTLDYQYLTTETLGKNGDALTPEQRSAYADVLKRLVQASYRNNLKDPTGFEVQYAGELPVGSAVLVQTVTKNKRNKRDKPLTVDYQVGLVDGGRRVQDVSTGGVSLVKNYKRQFGSIIKKSGFDELLKKMRERLVELEGPSG